MRLADIVNIALAAGLGPEDWIRFPEPAHTEDTTASPVYSLGGGRIIIDSATEVVTIDDSVVPITYTAGRLLMRLASSADKVVTHQELLVSTWTGARNRKPQNPNGVISAQISILRGMFPDDLRNEKSGAVRTIYGLGYMAVTSLE